MKKEIFVLYRKFFILGLLFLFSFRLAACGSDPTPVATTTPALTPLEIAARAAEAMLSVESLHFTIEREGALVYIDEDQLLAFKRAEGDFSNPDQLQAVVRLITVFTPVEVGMIVLGDEQYATDPITGQWDQLPAEWGQFNLAALFDPETGIQGLLRDGIIDLELTGSEEIGGQRHYWLTGRAGGEQVSEMTLGFIGGDEVEVQVWVGAEDYCVRRLYIVESATDSNDPTTWNMQFSNLGQPVEINAPPVPTA